MPQTENVFEQVDRLIHDADRAFTGAALAERMGDEVHAVALRSKARRLYADAAKLDPTCIAEAWDI